MIAAFIGGLLLIVIGTAMDKRERKRRDKEWEEEQKEWDKLLRR